MKYIVSWIVYILIEIPCPEGRSGCAVFHAKYEPHGKQQEFTVRDSAFVFYNTLLKQDTMFLQYEFDKFNLPDSVRIDSIPKHKNQIQ